MADKDSKARLDSHKPDGDIAELTQEVRKLREELAEREVERKARRQEFWYVLGWLFLFVFAALVAVYLAGRVELATVVRVIELLGVVLVVPWLAWRLTRPIHSELVRVAIVIFAVVGSFSWFVFGPPWKRDIDTDLITWGGMMTIVVAVMAVLLLPDLLAKRRLRKRSNEGRVHHNGVG